MDISIFDDPKALGKAAGTAAAAIIQEAINHNGVANIIVATGTSQFETLSQLTMAKDIQWDKVVMFHLDEYIGLSDTHPASFRKYLKERFLSKIPQVKAANLINTEADAREECDRLEKLIFESPIDLALVGIGENGHLAFNDPPADFETEQPYIVVELDYDCRKQQLGEGWFNSITEVPRQAISMSVKQIMKSKNIICSVPGKRKATAVKNSVVLPVNPLYPASILQLHTHCTLYLDKGSAVLL
ncbi:MAG: glucosamine-6-phosphate deaminase [Ginsengibacter sp.]